MEVTSPEFAPRELIPTRCTCDGENLSPELHWRDVPAGAVELAITCEDPDAPGGTFVHWVAWGLDPAKGSVGLGEVSDPAHEGRNDFGDRGYGGPCPPPGHGSHRYIFTVYAVDVREKSALTSAANAFVSTTSATVRVGRVTWVVLWSWPPCSVCCGSRSPTAWSGPTCRTDPGSCP